MKTAEEFLKIWQGDELVISKDIAIIAMKEYAKQFIDQAANQAIIKHELLTEAMRRLPKGSLIRVPYFPDFFISTGIFKMHNNDVIMETNDKNGEPIVYMTDPFNALWAEVVV